MIWPEISTALKATATMQRRVWRNSWILEQVERMQKKTLEWKQLELF